MEPRYLNLKEAAGMCGYSVRHFRRLVQDYGIPAYGPAENRYKPQDIDLFMECPGVFQTTQRVRRGGRFTLVTA